MRWSKHYFIPTLGLTSNSCFGNIEGGKCDLINLGDSRFSTMVTVSGISVRSVGHSPAKLR